MKEEGSKDDKRHEWLETLAAQSWQAELIASGLAIYGSLALAPLIDSGARYSQLVFNDEALDVMGLAFMYLYLAQAIITVCFVSHLAMRILWVGLLGLASAYPQGINTSNASYSRNFLTKLKSEFSDITTYTYKLDLVCSRIFSNFCGMAIVMFALSFWILLLIGVGQSLYAFTGVELTKQLMVGFIMIMFVIQIIANILNSKWMRNSKLSQKFGYPLYKFTSKPLLLAAYKPVNYTTWIQRTNQTTKQYLFGMIFMFMPIALLVGMRSDKVLSTFSSKDYFDLNEMPHYANDANYMDQVQSNVLLKPLIQSRNIQENYVQLFIPKLYRDNKHQELLCGIYYKEEKLEEPAERKAKVAYYEGCASSYFSISIDEGPQQQLNWNYLRNKYNNQRGYSTLIKLDGILPGAHLLKIKTGYKNKEGFEATRVIPFTYLPD